MQEVIPRAEKIVADFAARLTFIKNYGIIKGEGYGPSQQTKQ
jgi:hypothetical protein